MKRYKEKKVLRAVGIIAFVISIPFAAVGCTKEYWKGSGKTWIIQNGKFINQGLYEIDELNNPWKWHQGSQSRIESGLITAEDIVFTRCPGQQAVIILRAAYQPHPSPGSSPNFKKAQTYFEGFILDFLEESFSLVHRKDPQREILSHNPIQLVGYEAVEVLQMTHEEIPETCTSIKDTAVTKSIKSKFVFIKVGRWKDASSMPADSPSMIILWYASPDEAFEEGIREFDRMVQTFRFVKKEI